MEEITKRVLEEAQYIIDTNKTIRETAKIFKVSKSTVHKDIKERLTHINKELSNEIEKILKHHIDIRHIRGGESTRKKYQKNQNYKKTIPNMWYNLK